MSLLSGSGSRPMLTATAWASFVSGSGHTGASSKRHAETTRTITPTSWAGPVFGNAAAAASSSAGSSPSRQAWLQALLEEGQSRWHLARLGSIEDSNGSSLIAEVNLTGAPAEAIEDLFVTSLDALRWVVQWLGETADWLADVTVAPELLATCPNEEPRKGTT